MLPTTWTDASTDEAIELEDPSEAANVLGSVDSFPGGTSRSYAELQGPLLLEDFPAYEERYLRRVDLGAGRTAYRRLFEWTPEGDQRVRQLQVYCVECGQAYLFTATASARDFPGYEQTFDLIQAALR